MNFLNKFESFKNEKDENFFFCNFRIFKINSNLAVIKHRSSMSYSVIAKDRTKMEIIGKKERKKSFRARRY